MMSEGVEEKVIPSKRDPAFLLLSILSESAARKL
jgi:hypothetical protein